MSDKNLSRRKFVTDSGLVLSGLMTMGLQGFNNTVAPSNKIRLGLMGCGSRGCGLASLIKEMKGVELIACCDIQFSQTEKAMAYAVKNAKAYTDYRKLLQNKDIDAVIIATPLFLHYQMAIDSIDAGKHIYIEKSLTYDIPQVLSMVEKVKKSGLVFQVGYQYRYYSLYHKIREAIQQNWLGRITHFECQYNRNSNWRNPVNDPKLERIINWRMYREYCGGPLSELCAHELDMVNYLLNAHPLKAVGLGGINYWKDGRDTYDHVRTIYEYPAGVKASFTSVLSNAFDGYNIRILGDKATIVIHREQAFIFSESTENKRGTVDGVTGATIEATTQGKPVEIMFKKPGEPDVEPTTYAMSDFFTCIRDHKEPVSNIINAGESSISIHMGNMAMDTETVQHWKPEYSIG